MDWLVELRVWAVLTTRVRDLPPQVRPSSGNRSDASRHPMNNFHSAAMADIARALIVSHAMC
jgi:hypothetical protein